MKRSRFTQQLGLAASLSGILLKPSEVSTLVNIIERLGMLPPPEELENVTAKIQYYRMNHEVEYDGDRIPTTLLWEPEDE